MEGKLIINGEEFEVKIHNCELEHETIPEVGIGVYSNIEKFEEMIMSGINRLVLPDGRELPIRQ